jgi:hypothetical protein
VITIGAAADHAQREIDFGRRAGDEVEGQGRGLKHDPEKWEPVSGKNHAQTISESEMTIQPKTISL